MARTKVVKPSMPPEEISKDCGWLEYIQGNALRFFPSKQDWRKRLIYAMYQCLEEKDAKGRDILDVMQFCRRYKVPYNTLLYWAKQYEDVGAAYKDFKLYLASNRRVGAMHRELDKDAVFKDMHKYDPEWDEINKYHAALKSEQAQNETKVVVIERMPTTERVPDKK